LDAAILSIFKFFSLSLYMPLSNPLRFAQPVVPSDAERERMIAEAAYYLAEKRNFAPGLEELDWRQAASDIDARLGSTRLGSIRT
jgi:hypothetical protein